MKENLSEFLKVAYKCNKVKEVGEAFEEYPVEQEWHKGKIENVFKEQEEHYNVYEIGDIVFVARYSYPDGREGENHLFVIIDQNNMAIPIENFGMLISSQIQKAKYPTNKLLEKVSESLEIPLLKVECDVCEYEEEFEKALLKAKNQVVFCQHPYYISKKYGLQEALLQATENNKLIFIIHDVEFIRAFETEEKKKHEIEILNSASVIISHNQFMTEELKRNGVTNPKFVNLEIFDYLLDDIPNNTHNYGRSVVYAGNLAKAPFLDKLEKTKLGWD